MQNKGQRGDIYIDFNVTLFQPRFLRLNSYSKTSMWGKGPWELLRSTPCKIFESRVPSLLESVHFTRHSFIPDIFFEAHLVMKT